MTKPPEDAGKLCRAPDASKSICVSAESSDTSFEGERKTVAALFADIKGSMELIENSLLTPIIRTGWGKPRSSP